MDSIQNMLSKTDPIIFIAIAAVLAFIATVLVVLANGEEVADRVAVRKGIYERMIGQELYRLFLPITPSMFFIYHMVGILVLIVFGILIFENWMITTPFALVIGFFLPRMVLRRMWKKRLQYIDEQVEEAMIYMANSFKANPALPDAFDDVCNSMGPPISQEIQVMLKEYKLGTPLDNALINLQQRVPAKNLRLAIGALLIGRTVGGNIPKILEDIAGTIRESYRLERVIDSQTAQGKMQAWVMGAMPAAVIGLFYLLEPDLIVPLFNTFIGYLVLSIAVVLNVIGVLMILKIVSIQV